MTINDLLGAPEPLGRPALLDGAMGTELDRKGLEMGGRNCVTNPEAVSAVHRHGVEGQMAAVGVLLQASAAAACLGVVVGHGSPSPVGVNGNRG